MISPASLSEVVATTAKFSVPPTAPVVLTGCEVILIVLCTRLLATELIKLLAPAAERTQR